MEKTWGQMAKKALDSRSLLYFADVLDGIRDRLLRVEPKAATALAAACSSRLMAAHTSLPADEQRPLTLAWSETLGLIWQALEGSDAATAGVKQALDAFNASPYNHSDGQDGPGDANEDAAAAAIYTAKALCGSDAVAASWATHRLIDWAFSLAGTELGHSEQPLGTVQQFIEDAAHPTVQRELQRLLAGMELLEHEGSRAPVLKRLRAMYAAG